MVIEAQVPYINARYRVEGAIGSGGMGTVYRVLDRLNGEVVALKRVNKTVKGLTFSSKGKFANLDVALAQEFRTLSRLRHPNIVSVLDYGFDENKRPFYTMEYLHNAQIITQAAKRATQDEKIRYIIHILRGLMYLHRHGILHRDIKPANIVVENNRVKILDFGLAVVATTPSIRYTDDAVAGTFAYTAPEIFAGEPVSRASDLFAVGIIAFELLAGYHPFKSNNISEIINKILYNQISTADVAAIGVNEAFAKIIERLLAKDPKQRYVDAGLLIHDLQQAVHWYKPDEPATIRESLLHGARFVGRSEELNLLQSEMRAALKGQGRVWLIGGESGVGKTRLLDEIRTQALVQGALVVQGQNVDEPGNTFRMWREAVALLSLDTQLTDLELGTLKAIVPNIDKLVERPIPDPPALPPDETLKRINRTVYNLFIRREQPIVLLIEDLHWGHENLGLLRQLIRAAPKRPLFIIGTYRSEETPDLPRQFPGTEVLLLDRLKRSEVQLLCTSIMGQLGNQDELLDFVMKETQGNSLYIIEMLRTITANQSEQAGIEDSTLPTAMFINGIESAIQDRLRSIPPQHLALLKAAAILGREINLNIMQAFMIESDLTQWLIQLGTQGILEIYYDRWRFSHDKLREIIQSHLTQQELSEYSQRLAELIEDHYANDPQQYVRLSRLWSNTNNLNKEIHYRLAAGHYLNTISNFRESYNLVKEGHDRLYKMLTQEQQIQMLFVMAESCRYMSIYAESIPYYEEGLRLAEVIGDHWHCARMHTGLGLICFRQGKYLQAHEHFQASYTIDEQHGYTKHLADNLSNMGLIADYHSKNFAEAEDFFRRALALRHEQGNERDIGYELNNLGVVYYTQGHLAKAIETIQQAYEIRRRVGDREGEAMCLSNLGIMLREQGNYGLAEQYMRNALAIDYEIENRFGVGNGMANLASLLLDHLNRPQEAIAYGRTALNILFMNNILPVIEEVVLMYARYFAQQQQAEYGARLLGWVISQGIMIHDIEFAHQQTKAILQTVLTPDQLELFIAEGASLQLTDFIHDLPGESISEFWGSFRATDPRA